MAAQSDSDLIPWVDVGIDHLPPHLRAATDGNPRDLEDPAGLGLEELVGDLFELLKRSPEHRMLMAAARRAGRPQSWAEAQWADAGDVAWEYAWTAYNAWLRDKQCPHCGVDPDDILDPITNRLLEGGRVKVEKRGCEVCATTARHSSDIDQAEREMLGSYITTTTRFDGDPFYDDGGFEWDRGRGMSGGSDVDLRRGGFG